MDATQNHYGTCGGISPMVFLNREFWTRTKPVYPLLKELAREQEYAKMLTISDDVDEVGPLRLHRAARRSGGWSDPTGPVRPEQRGAEYVSPPRRSER